MAYNDFLEQGIHGGFVGMALFGFLVFYSVIISVKTREIEIQCILIVCVLMSLVNFVVQAIPLWILFITAIARVDSDCKSILKGKGVAPLLLFSLTVFSIITCVSQISKMRSEIILYDVLALVKQKKIKNAIELLQSDRITEKCSENYLYLSGKTSMLSNDRESAIEKFNMAVRLTSKNSLFFDLAHCHTKKGEYEKAEEYLLLISNMIPTNFRSRYFLLQIYGKQHDTYKQVHLSESILKIRFNPKNKDALSCRDLAMQIINNIPNSASPSIN